MTDNPPAFPCRMDRQSHTSTFEQFSGMALRDWFAGQIIVGMASDTVSLHPIDAERKARLAYQVADAMLEARKAKS